MIPQLLPEIYLKILQHVRQPLPPSHSPITISKSTIRQPALCRCLRVSKAFYALGVTVLYRTIVTDDLPLLFLGTGNRAIAGIASKAELLGRVEHLYIEYPEDSAVYYVALPPSGSTSPRMLIIEEDRRQLFVAIKIAEELFISWRSIFNHHDRRKPLFASLRTLSTGAFFGDLKESYWYAAEVSPRWSDLLEMARWGLYTMIRDTPSIRHVCGTGWGPLGLGDLPRPFKGGENCPTVSMHITPFIPDPVLVPFHEITTDLVDTRQFQHVPIGAQMRWFDHSATGSTDEMVREAFARTLRVRERLVQDPEGAKDVERNWAHGARNSEVLRVYKDRYEGGPLPRWDLDGTVYLDLDEKGSDGSGGVHGGEEVESRERRRVQELSLGEKTLSGGIKVEDRLRVRDITEAQCCACAWRWSADNMTPTAVRNP